MTTREGHIELQQFLQPRLHNYLSLLEEMVAINSFTANPAGVGQLSDVTAAAFGRLGFAAERVSSGEPLYGDHLFLTRLATPAAAAPTIGLVSHLDTVFPPGEERQNDFVWREEGDRIYGPGTVDIKGGTVVIYMLVDVLRTLHPQLFNSVNWVIMLNAAEEVLVPSFGQLCRDRVPDDALACLVFEGGQIDAEEISLVTARKGMVTYRIEVAGRAAHAGSAHGDGANAIVEIGHLVSNLADLTDYDRELTFNVGTIMGGSVINRVPHHAVASGEMRAFAPDVLDEGVRSLLAFSESGRVTSKDGRFQCSIEIEVLNKWSPWPENRATEALAESFERAAAQMGYRLKREHRGGLSDGNFLWDAVPTIDGLGPAGGNAHCSERSLDGSKEQEYALRSSFVPKATLSALAIMTLVKERQRDAITEAMKP